MSDQITVAEKVKVKRDLFFHFEFREAFRYSVCDGDIGTIKNVVMRASCKSYNFLTKLWGITVTLNGI